MTRAREVPPSPRRAAAAARPGAGQPRRGRRAAGVLALAMTLGTGFAERSAPALASGACRDGVTQWVTQPSAALTQIGVSASTPLPLQGDGVTVAVVDSGVDAANQHFPRGSVRAQKELASSPPKVQDATGHGTAVASIIAARRVGGSAMVGIAPGVTILPVRVYSGTQTDPATGGTRGPTINTMAQGIEYAVAAGAQVIVVPDSVLEDDAGMLANAVRRAALSNVVVVASAGDVTRDDQQRAQGFDTRPRYPAALPGVVGVTGVDANGVAGAEVVHGASVSIAAPGTGNLAAYKAWGDCVMGATPDGTQTTTDSYATGYVAGVAALLVQKHRSDPGGARADEVVYELEASAVRPLPTTRDADLGWGLLDPRAALDFVNDGSDYGPPNPRHVDQPSEQATPVAPAPAPDPHLGPLRRLVGWLAGATTAIVLGGLLASRLLRRR